ncbi:hypothetical protein F511_45798 [Dorcoceras hygrometricum]|uniref:Uncharacterized protein n=1 Tax=Dorcoceras hygrometricum TaxID=472368 RepID=A0A2Z6ZV66_9LAMI|nr:hypothetical protein F511_45798 [Dorcoceras hygrometricum]
MSLAHKPVATTSRYNQSLQPVAATSHYNQSLQPVATTSRYGLYLKTIKQLLKYQNGMHLLVNSASAEYYEDNATAEF